MEHYLSIKKERRDAWSNVVASYQAKSGVLEEQARKLEEAHAELEREKAKLAEQNGDRNVSDNDILDINAGGQIIRVTRETMTHFKGSRLEALFSGRWDQQLQRDSKGRIFLDVNPVCFKSIVDYLNECKISSPDNLPDPPFVDQEHRASLDGLLIAFGLEELCSPKIESQILTDPNHVQALVGFLSESGFNGGLELLYRGSRDGISAQSFRDRCNNQGSTITVVKSQGGHIFGGFVDQPWTGSGSYKTSSKAFLFGLHCFGSHDPIKLEINVNEHSYAMYDEAGLGPKFGCGRDLCIVLQGSTGTISSNLGNTYRLPAGGNTTKFFTNKKNLAEIEVFKVNNNSSQVQPPVAFPTTSTSDLSGGWVNESFDGLPQDLKSILLREKEFLLEATRELNELKEAFGKEEAFIQTFAKGEDADEVISLNVSGHPIVVRAATLAQFPQSVLYKHLADPRWNPTGTGRRDQSPRDWKPEQVVDWARQIHGISMDVSERFKDTLGVELLAMQRDDIKELGIQKPGTIALVLQAIQELRDEDTRNSAILIEHSEYCVGKIIDHMRLKAMSGIGVQPPRPPAIAEPERKRMRRIVEYYFPTESESEQFLDY